MVSLQEPTEAVHVQDETITIAAPPGDSFPYVKRRRGHAEKQTFTFHKQSSHRNVKVHGARLLKHAGIVYLITHVRSE